MPLLAHLLFDLLIFSILVLSLNFIVGKTSIWSVGHLGFFGVGAVAAAATLTAFPASRLSFWLALTAAVLSASGLSWIIGWTTLRLRQDFFVILSLAFAELVHSVSVSWKGPDGFKDLIRPPFLGIDIQSDWLFIAFVVLPFSIIAVFLVYRFSRLPLERVCALVRKNHEMAMVLGLSPVYYRLRCFILGSAAAAICGALSTFFFRSTDPNQILLERNLMVFAAVLFGGINSIEGAVIGGLVLVAVPKIMEGLIFQGPQGSYYAASVTQFFLGLILLLVIRFKPGGIAGASGLREFR